jgi:hypothetical protein
MYDTIMDENTYIQQPNSIQRELIERYCSEIKEIILKTESLFDAQNIASEQCEKFELLCESSVIQKAMRKYVDDIINERWGIH